MSKWNRVRSSDRLGERVEFGFSSFRAVQVPVVSDRLLITIISVDSGRTIAKTSKAAARNGICQWPDSILKSIRFSQDEVSKEIRECQCKITVSMGSTKTAILGEVFLNLTNYLSSSDPTDISLPLKRCNSSTVLQLKIQCLGAKSKSSGEPCNEPSPRLDDYSPADNDIRVDRNSDGPDSILDKSSHCSSGNHLGDAYQDEDGNRDASSLPPETHRSSNCGDGSTDIRNLSPVDNSNEGLYMGRQDSASSANHDSAGRGDDSSKGLLDTSEETIEEVRDEAKMWESHSRKLKIELEILKNECADKSKEQAELELKLSASHSERKSLRQEIEELKSSLEEVTSRQTIVGTPKSGDGIVLQKEIIDEVQLLKESNVNLTAQLNKSQEANIELVSILQELEETIELQRVEMSELSHASDMVDHEVSKSDLTVHEDAEWARILSLKENEITMLREKLDRILSIENVDGAGPDAIYLELEKENDFLKVKIHELQNDCSELTDENLELIYKLKEVSGVAKGEDPCISNSEEMLNVGRSESEVKYLERKCADLELNLLKFSSEFSELEEKFQKSQEELKERTLELSELREKLFQATELEGTETGSPTHYQQRSGEPDDTESDLDVMNHRVLLQEREIEGLQISIKELENIISDTGKEKSQLEDRILSIENVDGVGPNAIYYELEKENDFLKVKIHELENDCSELTDKNLEPIYKLKEVSGVAEGEDTCISNSEEMLNVGRSESEVKYLERKCADLELNQLKFSSEFSDLEEKFQKIQEELKERTLELSELREKLFQATKLEGTETGSATRYQPRSGEPDDTESDLDVMNRRVVLQEQEIEGLQNSIKELENIISDTGKEKSQLEDHILSIDLDVMNRRVLLQEREIEGLQNSIKELENIISDTGKEKSQLEDHILNIENVDGAGPDAIYLELEKENDFLKVKIHELQNDCSELTDKNLELIYKLKEVSGVAEGEDPCISNSEKMLNVGRSESEVKYLERKCADLELNLLKFSSEFSELEEKFQKSQEELKERTLFQATELEGTETGSATRYQPRSGEPDDTESDLDVINRRVLLQEREIEGLQNSIKELENIISDIGKEKSQLEDRILSIENMDGAGPDAIYLKLEKENDFLKVKIHELQNDCSELTDKNLELIYKLKEVSGVAEGEDPCISNSEEMPNVGRSASKVKDLERKCADLELNLLKFSSEFSELEEKFQKSQEELKERTLELSELREKLFQATELERTETGCATCYQPRSGEPDDTESDLDVMNRRVLLQEREIEGLQSSIKELENIISDTGKEKYQLEDRILSIENVDGAGPNAIYLELEKENDFLKVKIHELENDCSELTDKNLELIYKLKEVSGVAEGEDPCISNSEEMPNVGRSTSKVKDLERKCADLELNLLKFSSEFSELEEKFQKSQEELKERTLELSELREKLLQATELEGTETGSATCYQPRSGEPDDTKSDLDVMNRRVVLQEREIEGLQNSIKELENIISDTEKEKSQLEDRILSIENVDGAGPAAIYLELEKENDLLKVKIHELENDCSELTGKNLELIYKLKEVSGAAKGEDPCISNSEGMPNVGRSESEVKYLERKCADLELNALKFSSEFSELEEKFQKSQEELKERTLELSELREKFFQATELEGTETGSSTRCQPRSGEPDDTESDLDVMNRRVLLKEQEIEGLQNSIKELENIISDTGKEKSQLEERLVAALQESSMTSKCLDAVREDLLELTRSVDSHVSTNKVLETKIIELEISKFELESHVTKLEHENVELSEFISEIEAQLISLTRENESTMLQMDHSVSMITNLTDMVEQQQVEMEGQKLELRKTHLESQRRLSEVQEDSEALRRLNVKLQSTIDCVVEECNCLKTLIADLKKQKLELHDHSTELEQKLEQSKRKAVDFCSTVEFLEVKLSSLQKEVSSKEQSLLSELENIFQEHKEHEERIDRAHFLLNKIENEKIVEVRNLEREVMSLTAQLSSTDGERESVALDSIHEVSILRADKDKLEANLEDVSTQMRHYESQLEDLRKESHAKIKGLVDSLNTSKQNEETLTTDVEHMRKLMEAARSNEENLRQTSGELELKYKSCDYEKQQIIEEISELKNQVLKMATIQDEVFKLQSSLDEAKFEKGKLEELIHSLSEECEELKVQKAMLTDKVSCMQGSLHDADEEDRSKSFEVNIEIKQGHDASNDNGGGPHIQSKIKLLETRLAEALEENKLYKVQLQSPTREEQSGSKDGKETNDGNKIAQLESELKDMQDRLLNVSMQYAEVEAQREELVMELKTVTARKGRWF